MITITAEGYTLKVEGHARYAPAGQDIVCAAVSSLFCTLAGGLSGYDEYFIEPPVVYAKSGFSQFQCDPKPESVEKVDLVWRVFMAGLQTIALQYPQNVIFLQK